MFEIIDGKLNAFFAYIGVEKGWIDFFTTITEVILSVIISYVLFKVAQKFIIQFLKGFAKRTKSKWDDILIERKVFNRLAFLVPAYILYWLLPYALDLYPEIAKIFMLAIEIYSIVIIMLVGLAFLDSILHIYHQYSISKSRPIKGYVQVGKILVYILAVVSLISILIGKSPLLLIGGLGAFSAVLLLVFKDAILGLVAGVQLTANDMLRPGDWISMPKYDADGTVIDITLTTIKVQNWDKTISTVPAYSLFTDSFKNWRGMEESGGRRIKRSINIDMNSVKFCTEEMLGKFEKFQFVTGYIKSTEEQIQKYNKENNVDPDILVNGRRQTNIGIFRAYLQAYLKNRSDISDTMTFLIRQLQPSETGIPMEIYVFSRIQAWAEYEAIQADIFDHILAVIPQFDLRVFQNPSGADFKAVLGE